MSNYQILGNGLEFPEGPVIYKEDSVLVVEIKGRCITQIFKNGDKSKLINLEGAPNGAAIGPDGALYVCNNGDRFLWGSADGITKPIGGSDDYSGGRIERIDLDTGEVTELYRTVNGHTLRMPNDIVFDKQGGFYFTDYGMVIGRAYHSGGVYYGKIDGSQVSELIFPITTPNGIGLSPDEETLYVAGTETGRLWHYKIIEPGVIAPIDRANPSNQLLAQIQGFKRYDSLAVEANGNICIAGLTPGCITIISPQGEQVEVIKMPDPFSTNLCFGGKDMRDAYLTMSGSGKLIKIRWPRSGLKLNFQL